MKKKMILVLSIGIFLGILKHVYGVPGATWFAGGAYKIKSAASYIKNNVAAIFKVKVDDPIKLNEFKAELLDVYKRIEQKLLVTDDAHEIEDLENTQNVLNTILKEYDTLLNHAQEELTPSDFKLLQKELEQKQSVLNSFLNNLHAVKTNLTRLFKVNKSSHIKSQILRDNPYKDQRARVVQNQTLLVQEKEFIAKRLPIAQRGLEIFFNQPLASNQVFRMGFAGSGGGYRALILTLGYLLGLEQLGLYDACMYSSSLSGSTWLAAPQVQMGKSLQEYKQALMHTIFTKQFDLVKMQYVFSKDDVNALIDDVLWPKFMFGIPIGSIDLYGSLLGRVFLSATFKDYQKQYLPDQWSHVQSGKQPFPIYSAVSMHKTEVNDYLYNWYEFNPLEIRNLELNLAIPSYAFGWRFDQGVSREAAPLATLGYLMGIWGSAYTVNIKDINNAIKSVLKDIKAGSWFARLKTQTLVYLLGLLGQTSYLNTVRVSPAQVYNPFKNMPNVSGWLSQKPYLVFVDAGVAYNLAIRPLLRKERALKVIFIGDSSASVALNIELAKALDDAWRVYGYKYTRVDKQETETLQLYKDLEHKEAPCIVYVNFLNDQQLISKVKPGTLAHSLIKEHDLESFDPISCLRNGYCQTANLGRYTEKQFLQLMNMATFNVLANADRIRQFLAQEFGIKDK